MPGRAAAGLARLEKRVPAERVKQLTELREKWLERMKPSRDAGQPWSMAQYGDAEATVKNAGAFEKDERFQQWVEKAKARLKR